MNMDPLKEFVDKNRSSFDELNPPPLVWRSLEMELEHLEPKVIPLHKRPWLRVAATAIVFLCVGLGAGQYLFSNQEPYYVDTPEWQNYLEAKDYLQQRVEYTKAQIGDFPKSKNVENDLKQLDEVYGELKQELMNNQTGNSDVIIDAMIQNYHTKIEILERVLDKTEKTKYKNYDNENLDI